ncbi:MAG TPA: AAA family ATPase [Gaiellaceae bacterium]|nr:AAA family ATPase [Gaiellaceae bacterium]
MDILDLADSHPSAARAPVQYLKAFRQHSLLITLVVVIGVVSTAAITYTQPKRYTAAADVQVTPVSPNDGNFQGFSLFHAPLDGSSVVVAAARVMSADSVRRAANQRLGRRADGSSVRIAPLSQADIVAVTATAPNPQQAADVANTYSQVFVAQRTALFRQELAARIAALNRQIAAIPAKQRAGNFMYSTLQGNVATFKGYLDAPDPTVSVLTHATPPGSPSSPRPRLNIAVAFIVSLLLAAAVALRLELVNPRLSGEDELVLGQRLPILARIPRLSGNVAAGYLTGKALLPANVWRAYRTLGAVLATAGTDGGYPRSIMVTSPSPGDGKTMTAVNLAITLAAANLKVVLVDGDFHRPMISSIFNVPARRNGLGRVLAGESTLDGALIPAPSHPRLDLLLSAREHADDLQLLEVKRFAPLLDDLAKRADVVVIDSPPITEVAEALSLAAAAEAVLISVRIGHTRREKLERLRELFERRGISPLGFAVTTRRRPEFTESEYDYGGPVPEAPAAATRRKDPAERVSRTFER